MPAPARSSVDFEAAVVLRWMMKAFLLGLFLGVGAAINALV